VLPAHFFSCLLPFRLASTTLFVRTPQRGSVRDCPELRRPLPRPLSLPSPSISYCLFSLVLQVEVTFFFRSPSPLLPRLSAPFFFPFSFRVIDRSPTPHLFSAFSLAFSRLLRFVTESFFLAEKALAQASTLELFSTLLHPCSLAPVSFTRSVYAPFRRK